jgi:tetratricopeptide (TPR) repeat protein
MTLMTKDQTPRNSWRLLLLTIVTLFALAATLTSCGNDPLKAAREADSTGDYRTAIAGYQEKLKQDPDNEEAIKGLAVDLFLTGDFNGALPYEEKVVAADPKDAQTRMELGFNYLNHQGQAAKAVQVLSEVVELEPTAKSLTYLGQAEMGAKQTAQAEQTLRQAIAKEPSYGRAYTVLIQLLEQQGRTADAEQARSAAAGAGAKLEGS